jgi:hypothetical protein
MSDEPHDEEKEIDGPTPGAIVGEGEIEVPHDDFDALFPPEAESIEEEDAAAYKPHNDEDDEDYPFSGDEE